MLRIGCVFVAYFTIHILRISQDVYVNEKEAYEAYRSYGYNLGFSVRKDHHSYWPNSRNLKSKDFVCSKAGFKKLPDLNIQRKYRRSDTRTGCPAMVRFTVDEAGYWKVKKFIENHNHDLPRPEDRHLLRSCRNMCDEKASVLKAMTDAGIRTIDAFSFLADEVGGVENIGFTRRDAYNFIQKIKRAGDTNTLIELFKERQLNDNMFSWDVQKDEFDRLLNFFWVDAIGKIDYDCFGDVVIFYTSYRLNKYNLVCAPFVGVNNHWQNILLGVTFLSEENIESFIWVFTTFVRMMGDKQPITIYTDQDQAMARAIEVALPHSRHRLCQWHIRKKAPSKVSCYNTNNKVKGLFNKCLSRCDSEEEFENAWAELIIQGNLQDHVWLQDLYRIRNKWSTAFNKDYFSMDILSTQLQGVGVMSVELESSDSSKFFVYYTETKDHSKPWVVDFDAQNGNIQCSCRKFETMGLLCSHCIIVLRQMVFGKIPEKYLLLRW
ncbi:Protein FAR1-RELATED SEQUENCE 5 [Dendrobium catenatum]|uniref:Protein FAR1-RELATED SEQUENCE 5 n=1 Tax=Dendrobium catenatum TaxID=906689 RepID=A0A2I0VPA5_9ASPA|nr:Protein FAR1-RELATED SEQUENCE 5 [Dendrobium catenatum]